MLLAYKYIVANEGLDTNRSYPFQGKVIHHTLKRQSKHFLPNPATATRLWL